MEKSNTTDLTKRVEDIISQMEMIEIIDDASYIAACEFLKKDKETQKYIDGSEAKAEQKRRYKDYQSLQKQLKKLEEQLEAAEKIIKRKVAQYAIQKGIEAKVLEEDHRLEAAIETGDDTLLDITVPVELLPKVEGISFAEDWQFEVTDEKAVPEEYKKIDSSSLRKVVKALKANAQIQGVRVYQTKQVRVSA